MKKTIIFLIALTTSLSLFSTASAKGGGGHGGGGSHAGGGHATGHTSGGHVGGSGSVGRATVSRSSHTTTTRSFTRSGAQVNRAMSSRMGQKTTQSLTTNSQRLNLGGSRSYVTYASHPYSSRYYTNNHFSNVWFYYWMFSHNWSNEQKTIAQQNGMSQETAQKILQNSKHITIEDNGDKQVIIVTPKQYDKIKVGDKVSLKNNVLLVNGKAV